MISHELRRAIKQSGKTAYALAKAAKVDPSAVKKFTEGTRGLSLDTYDPLAEVLGLRIVKADEPIPSAPPPDYEERILQAAAQMAFDLFRSLGETKINEIVSRLRERRLR